MASVSFVTYSTRHSPSTRIRISFTPRPTDCISFQSLGSSPFWIARSSKPATRRASSGKSRRASRLDPINFNAFVLIRILYKFLYILQVYSLYCLYGPHKRFNLLSAAPVGCHAEDNPILSGCPMSMADPDVSYAYVPLIQSTLEITFLRASVGVLLEVSLARSAYTPFAAYSC